LRVVLAVANISIPARFLHAFWLAAGEMAPYLLFGFAAAAVSGMIFRPDFIERHFGPGRKFSILKAVLLGVPLPLCSCSVLPLAVSLRKNGASRGATAAFLVSTPQTGVDSILVTYGMLGPVFTIMRPLAAVISGLAGGFLINRLDRGPEAAAAPVAADPAACRCEDKETSRFADALRYGFVALPRDIGGPLLLGLLVAALIGTVLPDNFLGRHAGAGIAPMLLVMLVAVPMYVCATASVPVAAALLMNGLSPGAAFVFLMAGPATSAASIATVWKSIGPRSAVAYLLTVAVFSLIFGLTMDVFFSTIPGTVSSLHAGHAGLPAAVKNACAAALFLLLAVVRVHYRAKQT